MAGFCLLAFSSPAAEPAVESSQLPRVPPTSAERAVSTFTVKKGFRADLVAAEPLVMDPIALSFDEDGVVYVVEMRDYSERRPERLGRIRRLEDVDGDGHFDRSNIFAADLPWPTAVICYGGGIFVGCTPDILWIRDMDGDGVSEEREVVFTGFAADFAPFATNRLNVQALLNSFNWSLDNRIHGATSFSGGKVRLADTAFVRDWVARGGPPLKKRTNKRPANTIELSTDYFKRTLDLRGRDFSFDPRRLEMRAESGGGQHGLSFDDFGRKFVCANSSHIQTLMYEERYTALNPASLLSRALVEIAVDGGPAPVFRLSPDEPWRVLRTQWRVAGLVSGPIEGGGKPSGYFTGATGVTIYRGDAYGPEFVGNAFIGDAGGNLIHRKQILTEGISLKAVRPEDERDVEFLASTDNWFRPVQFANAPDGCLYVCDMYREVIEHPWSLPQSLKRHLDLNSGNDRGRIYRIVPEMFKQPRRARLSRVKTRRLVEMLELANGWHRDAAARLIYERQDPAAVSALRALLNRSKVPIVKVHALYALAGQGALEWPDVSLALSDSSPEVRFHGVRLSERSPIRETPALGSKLTALSRDPEVTVRRQLAFTAGLLPPEQRMATVEALMTNGMMSGYSDALFNSVGDEAITLFRKLAVRDPSLKMSGMEELAGVIGTRRQSSEIAEVIGILLVAAARPTQSRVEYWYVLRVADGLTRGLESAGASVRGFDSAERMTPIYALAREWIATPVGINPLLPSGLNMNLAAISVLGSATYEQAAPVLLPGLENPLETTTILTALARCSRTRLADDLLERWPRLSAQAREQAVVFLLKRPASIQGLLTAIERGSVQRVELSLAQRSFLQGHQDKAIRQKAVELFGQHSTVGRQSVIESFQPALDLKGTVGNGQKLFQSRCASCHKLGAVGESLGPDLVTVRNGGKEKILTSLIDPNRELNGNFAACLIETKDGETLLGIVSGENASSVTLRMAGGMVTVLPRTKIATRQNQNRSLMPEGLEEGMTQQDMADLLEFVLSGP